MAYGEAGMPPLVKPNAFIIYHVEVLGVTAEGQGESSPAGPIELLRPSSVSARGEDGTFMDDGGRASVCFIEGDEGEQEELMNRAAQSMDLSSGGK